MRGSRPLVVSSPLAIAIGSVLGIALPGLAWGQSTITTPDAGSGRDLGTTITSPETDVYDVRSGRTRGAVDFNSFGRFEVGQGDTVNLLLNDGAHTVVNLVWDARALIDGTLNSYIGDDIGGRVVFADSHGLVVGQSGVLNVGSLAVTTPSQSVMTGLLGEARATAGATPHLDGLLSGQSELSDHGEVEIAGRVNASGEVRILARSIDATGTVWVADGAHGAGTGGAVNAGDGDTFQLIEAEGRILLAAADSLVVGGTVHAEGGDVLLQAGDEVSIAAGGVVSARDLGGQLTGGDDAALSGGDSGSVLVTGRDIRVAAGARIEADADGAHSGGDIDLHASDLAGGQTGRFTASSSVHANGTLRGSDIRMSATSVADSSWTDPDADLLTVAANELVEIAQKAGSELGGTLGYLATDTRAEVVVGANADIIAAGDVTALARTGQILETGVTGLKGGDQLQDYVSVGAMWADLDTVATAKVEAGASIDAGGTLAVKAETDSKVDISATSFAADGTAVAMTLAISTIDIQADATIEAGVDLQVGNLDVGALNISSFSTTAKAHSDEEGAVGLAAAVSLQDVSADAWLGSGLDAVGDVTVQAASLTSRNAMEAAVSAPPEDKEEPAAEGGGESHGDSAIAGLMGQGFDKLSGVLGSQGGDDDTGDGGGGSTPSAFRLGGAMTYLEGDHAASAKIGDAAQVTAGGDVSVHADVEHSGISIIAGTAIAAQGKDDDGSALSLSAGVSLTDLGHDAEAEIGAGVVVDAQRIGVGSEVVLPHDLSKLEAARPDFSSFGAFVDSLNAAKDLVDNPSEIFTSYGSASASADTVAIGGVINHYKVTNSSRAWVGEGASLTSRAAAPGAGEDSNWETALAGDDRKADWLDAVAVQALSDSQSMHAAGELKIGSVQAGQDGAAIGGSFNNVVYDTTTIAGIAADAVVVADDGVAVDATTRDNVVSLALMSGKGSSIGVDGTMALLDVSSTTRASVSRDADITAGSLEIGALQDLFVWSVSGALAMANSVSVGLGVGIHNLATDTRAYIGDNTVDAAGAADDAQVAEGVRGDGRIRVDGLRVDAQSKGLAGAIAVAGAVTQSDSQQQPVDEDKKPGFMSRLKDSAETKVDSARNSAADAFSGLPGLDKLNDKLRGEQGAGTDPGAQPAQPKFGISVSGSASVNLVSQDVSAYLDGADVAGRPVGGEVGTIDRIDVAALNDTVLASASGSAAITKAKADSSKFSAAIGGAVAYSMVDNDTDAHVSASRLADADAVAVHAISGGEQTNVALGVSVNASSNQSNAVSAVGSFTIGRSSNDTRAGLEDSELIAGDGDDSTLDVSAYGRTHVGTGAGSLYYGGRGGIGAAFTHADIRDGTGASIEGGSISGYDRVELNALDASRIIAGAAMAGGGGQSNGLGGSVVYNNVDNATRARIGGGARIDTDGDLVVRAAGTGPIAAFEDRLHAIDSDAEEGFNYSGAGLELDVQESDGVDLLGSGTSIIAVAGLVQAGKNSLGLSFVGNNVSNTHAVEVTDAAVSSGGTARLDARDSTAILGISVGLGASSDKFAAVGSATANMIGNRTGVLLGDAAPGAGTTVFNVGALDVSAADNSFIGSLAGSVVLGGKAAVGAAISYNDIGNTTSVVADGIQVTTGDGATFDADNNARIVSGAIAGAASENAAVAGSFAWSEIGNTTEAVLRNSALQGGSLGVHAGSGSDIFTLSGSVAVSSKAGIGAAINIADIGDRTEARIEDSQVDVDGAIEVLAEGTGIARSLAVAGAVAGNVAVGGSSSNAIVDNVIAARVSGLSGVGAGAGAGADELIVRAENTGEAASLAGAIAGSSSAAIGAAVSVNLVGGETVAELLDSELEVRDRVAVEAASSARINTLAAAGAAAGSVGGTLTSTNNVVGSRTRATLADTSLRPSDPAAELEDILTDTTVSAVDSSRIDSIATSVGVGGTAGIGAAVAVNVIGTEVSAEVLGGQNGRRYLGRNLVVQAESNSDGGTDGANINTIAAGAGGGGTVGGAGSVAVNVIEGSVSAEISDGADVVSVNNVGVLAANTQGINVFAGALAAGGKAGVGLGTVVNVMEGSTRAAITGVDTRVSALATDADDTLSVDDGTLADVSLSGIEDIADYVMPDLRGGTHEVSGLAVNAASRQHITTIGASAAAAGYAAGAVMAGANVIGGLTEAVIEDATINRHAEFALEDPDPDEEFAGIELNWQEVDVRASSHAVGANMVAGFAGAGGGAAAGALATNVFNGHTSAAIRDAEISAMQGVAVNANASQNSLIIGAGLAAGGLAGGAGTAIVNVFNASTEAAVEGGELEARSLDVEAANRNVASLVGGAVAGGGGGAVAGSFVVNVSQTRTSATLGSADADTTVETREGVSVAADADTRFEGVAVSGAAGGAVGVAGMAQVNVIGNSVDAAIVSADVDAGTDVLVSAHESLLLNAYSGAMGLSVFGSAAGAGASVAVLSSRVAATVTDSDVEALGNFGVTASSDREVEMIALTAGAGSTAGIGAAASLLLAGVGDIGGTGSELGGTLAALDVTGRGSKVDAEVVGGSMGGNRLDKLEQDASVRLDDALDGGEDRVMALVLDSKVDAQDVAVTADSTLSSRNLAGGVGVGGIGAGGAVAFSGLYGKTLAMVEQTRAGATGISARGDIAISASSDDGSSGAMARVEAYAGGAGLVGLGAAVAIGRTSQEVGASAAGTLSGAGGLTISASDGGSMDVDAIGAAAGAAAVGIVVADARRDSEVSAALHAGSRATGFSAFEVSALGSGSVSAYGLGAAGGVFAAGTGAGVTARDDSEVTASIGDAVVVEVAGDGGTSVAATLLQDVEATGHGAAVSGGVTVGAVVVEAASNAKALAEVGDDAVFSGGDGLEVASRVAPADTSGGVSASSIAGTGGLFVSVNASSTRAHSQASSIARVGNDVRLPDGDIHIAASNSTRQSAQATGISVGGLAAAGAVVVDASSNTVTRASLGDGATNHDDLEDAQPTGSLLVKAEGVASNTARAVGGSGGLVSGNAARASTDAKADVSATIGDDAHLLADSIGVGASHESLYQANSDSRNAAVIGGSGAMAYNTADARVHAGIGDRTQLHSGGGIDIRALNVFDALGASTTSAAGGGVINGSAADMRTRLAGRSSADIGEQAMLFSGLDGSLDGNGDISVVAATRANARDEADLSTGGAIDVAVVASAIEADFDNAVWIGRDAVLGSFGYLNLGTYTQGVLASSALVNTWGLAAVGRSRSNVDIDDRHSVVVGDSAKLESLRNTYILAGSDRYGLMDSRIGVVSNAEGYVRGLIAVPSAASNVDVSSRGNLVLRQGSEVLSASNVTIGAPETALNLAANGVGRGYQLGFIPVTQRSSNANGDATGTVVIDGDVVAGRYNELEIRIDSAGNLEQLSGLPVNALGLSSFNAGDFLDGLCGGDASADSCVALQALANVVDDGDDRGAWVLAPMFAAGGDVFLDGTSISGSGSVNAQGDARIEVVNESNRHLLVSAIEIPDNPGGNVNFVGAAGSAGNVHITQSPAGGMPSVKIHNAGGSVASAPLLMTMEDIHNISGSVELRSDHGSIGQLGTVYAAQQNVHAPNGVVTFSNRNADWFSGSNPMSDWRFSLRHGLFGGLLYSWVSNPDLAVVVIANAQFNPSSAADLQNKLYYRSPRYSGSNRSGNSLVLFGSCLHGTNGGKNDAKDGCQGGPFGTFTTRYEDHKGVGAYMPYIPFLGDSYMNRSVDEYSSNPNVARNASNSSFRGQQIFVEARYIDINSRISAGAGTNWSLNVNDSPQLQAWLIAQDQSGSGLVRIPAHLLGADAGSRQIGAHYDVANRRIVIDDVNASGGGLVHLDGRIVSTTPHGAIDVSSGFGQVRIDSGLDRRVQLQDINVGAGPDGVVTIIDRLKPTHYGNPHTTWYVHSDGETHAYDNRNGATSYLNGVELDNTDTYNPQANTRFEWGQQARVQRSGAGGKWYWVDQAGRPLDDGQEWSITGSGFRTNFPGAAGMGVYESRITGSFNATSTHGVGYSCKKDGWCSYGYDTGYNWVKVPSSGSDGAYGHGRVVWEFSHATRGTLNVTSSVKADNAIRIDFVGNQHGLVDVDTTGDLLLSGRIYNPGGLTRLGTTGGLLSGAGDLIRTTDRAMITTRRLEVDAAGGVGMTGQGGLAGLQVTLGEQGALVPGASQRGIHVRSGSSAGVDLDIRSDAPVDVVAGSAAAGYGNVRIQANGDIVALNPQAAVNITGGNISLESRNGAIGSTSAPLQLRAVESYLSDNTLIGGTVDATASGDIGLRDHAGDFWVSRVESRFGDVYLDAESGSLLDASLRLATDGASQEYIDQVRARLRLDGSGVQDSVAAYEGQVNNRYREYWQLRELGEMVDGQYVPGASLVPLFRAVAEAARGEQGLSDQQVLDYISERMLGLETFFADEFGAQWATQEPFLAHDAGFSFTIDPASQRYAEFENNSIWTEQELRYSINANALRASGGSVGQSEPTVIGRNIRLDARDDVGRLAPDLDIAYQDLLIGNLDDTAAMTLALANAPGDVLIIGRDGRELSQDDLAALSDADIRDGAIQFIRIKRTSPLFIQAVQSLAGDVGGNAYVQGLGNLLLDGLHVGGNVRLAANGDIANAIDATGTALTTGGDAVLNAGGNIGRPGAADEALTVAIGGRLLSAVSGQNLLLNQTSGDLVFGSVYANGRIGLEASGGHLLAFQDQVSLEGQTVRLSAQGDIAGVDDDGTRRALKLSVAEAGQLDAQAGGRIWLSSPERGLNIGTLDAGSHIDLLVEGGALSAQQLRSRAGTLAATVLGAMQVGRAEGALGVLLTALDDIEAEHVEGSEAGLYSGGDILVDVVRVDESATLDAGGAVRINSGGSVQGEHVGIGARSLQMLADSRIEAGSTVDVSTAEDQSLGRIAVGETGSIRLVAGGQIVGNGDDVVHLVGDALAAAQLEAGTGIGTGQEALRVSIGHIDGSSTEGDIHLDLPDGGSIGTLVAQDGSIRLDAGDALSFGLIDAAHALSVDGQQIAGGTARAGEQGLRIESAAAIDVDRVTSLGDASLTSAGDTTVNILTVGGDLLSTAGADLVLGATTVGGNATLASGDDTRIDVLDVGVDLAATAGGNLSLQAAMVGGQAALDSQYATTLGEMKVDSDLVAEAGTRFEAVELTVGGDAEATAADIALATAQVDGHAQLVSHASTALGSLAVGRTLSADAGTTFDADQVLVGESVVLTSGTDTTITMLEVGDELAATAGGELTLATASVGGHATLDSVGNTAVDTLTVGGDLLLAAGADLVLGAATVGGNATLSSGDETRIDVLDVGGDVAATAGGSLSLRTGTVGGQAALDSQDATTLGDMTVGGDLVAEAGTLFEAVELTVGGDAAVTAADIALATAQVGGHAQLVSHASTALGSLAVGRTLSADAGTTFEADDVLVGESATLTSGTDITITTLAVGGDLAATAGGSLSLQTGTVGGQAVLDSGEATTLGDMTVDGDLVAEAGTRFEAVELTVGGDAAVTAADIALATAHVGGHAQLVSHDSTALGSLTVGRTLLAEVGTTFNADHVLVGESATLTSGTDTTITMLEVGDELAATAGGELTLATAAIGGHATLDSVGNTAVDTLTVGGDLLSTSGANLALGTAMIDGSATLASANDTVVDVLAVGGNLHSTAGIDLVLGTATVGGNATLSSGDETRIDVLDVGVDLAATAGGSLALRTGTVGGQAALDSQYATTLGEMTVDGDLVAEAGTWFEANELAVGGDAAVTAADIALATAQVDGHAQLVSHASTALGSLAVGRTLSADAGTTLDADRLLVGESATLVSGTDTTIATLAVGGDLAATAGGSLSLQTGTVGGQAALDSGEATTLGDMTVDGDLVAEAGTRFESVELTVGGDAVVTAADIALATAQVGGHAQLVSHASTALGSLAVGRTLSADAGTTFDADHVLVGESATLTSGTDTAITTLEVGADLAATAGGNLSLQTGTVGSQAVLSAGRDATLGTLAVGRNLDIEAGRSIAYADIDAGGDVTALAVDGDIEGDVAAAGGAVAFDAGNDIRVAGLTAGERVDLVAGRDVDGRSIAALGTDVTVHAGHDIDLDEVTAARDVLLYAGNAIRLGRIDAGRDLGADAGTDLQFDTMGAGRDLTLRSRGGSIEGGSLQAGRHADLDAAAAVAVDDSSTGGDYRIVAGTDTDLLRYRVGGRLDLDAGGDVSIGEGRGEGMQSIDAGGAIAFGDVAGADAIRMEASGGGIDGRLLSALQADLSARDHIGLDLARIDSRLNLAATDIRGTVEQTGSGSDPIEMVLTGYRDGVARRITLSVDARDAWVMNRLAAMEAVLETSVAKVDIEEGQIGETMSLATPVTRTWMHNQDPALRPADVQLIQPGLDFMLSQRGNHTFTDAFVVRYGSGFWVEAPNHLAPRYWTDIDYYAESAIRFTFRTLEGELWSHQGLARHPFNSWGVAPASDEDPVQMEPSAVNMGVSH